MRNKRLNFLFAFIRGFISYGCFVLIQLITIIEFNVEISLERFYEVYGEVSPAQGTVYRVLAIIAIMFLTIYGFSLWNKNEKCKYLALEKKNFSAVDEARSILKSPDFLSEIIVYMGFTLLSSVLYIFAGIGKSSYTLKYIWRLFFGFKDGGRFAEFATVTLVMAIIIFTASLTARLFVRSHILKNYRPEEAGKFSMDRLKLAVYVVAVGLGFYLFTPYMHVIGNNIPAISLVLSVVLPVAVVIAALIFFVKYFRTFRRRIAFISGFKKMCRAENIELSQIKRPLLSVIFENKGANFSIKSGEKEFECKLISGAKRNAAIIFRDDGIFQREHSVKIFDFTVFRYRTKHSYSFESDKKKILVVCPKCEMQVLSEGRESIIFAGESVGGYTVYDEAAFERAVQFGYLGEKK